MKKISTLILLFSCLLGYSQQDLAALGMKLTLG